MAQNDLFQRYLDAGTQFTQMTRARAEAIVRDLVKAGEVQAEQTQALVAEVLDRSRRNTERLVEQIQKEVRKQLSVAEFVTKDTVSRLQSQIDDLRAQLPGPIGGGTSLCIAIAALGIIGLASRMIRRRRLPRATAKMR